MTEEQINAIRRLEVIKMKFVEATIHNRLEGIISMSEEIKGIVLNTSYSMSPELKKIHLSNLEKETKDIIELLSNNKDVNTGVLQFSIAQIQNGIAGVNYLNLVKDLW